MLLLFKGLKDVSDEVNTVSGLTSRSQRFVGNSPLIFSVKVKVKTPFLLTSVGSFSFYLITHSHTEPVRKCKALLKHLFSAHILN